MENTAKNFALQLGSLITLYVSIGALITLLFGIITVQYPDQASYVWEHDSATSSIRFAIALLIVFFPSYIALTRFVNVIRRSEQGMYLTLTKWLIYLSLLIGGGILLGDLVAILNSFLEGELTVRFLLKALTVFLVTGTAFSYYLLDVRAYWQNNEQHSIYYAGVVGAAVLVSLVAGFMNTDTPQEVRNKNLDNKEVSELQEIQSRIESYTLLNSKLPESIDEAYNSLSVPSAPEGRSAYTYQVINASSFKLCAEFSNESIQSGDMYYASDVAYKDSYGIINPNNWDHGKGTWCYTRIINIAQ
jgi:hypothetical protein